MVFQMMVRVPESAPKDFHLFFFWNLENFFDWRDDEQSDSPSDAEFSSRGARHWTQRKFQTKCHAVSKALLRAGDVFGRLPDVVGFAEVENCFVLERLLKSTTLRKLDYRIVHFDSPDPRGIDVALLYRSSVFKLLHARPLPVKNPDPEGETLLTRDLLLVALRNLPEEKDSLVVLVNHHPSKFGGGATDWRRRAALTRLRSVADSLQASGMRNVVAMGDFNDTPDSPAFDILHPDTGSPGRGLWSKAEQVFRKGEGTIRYDGRWELIDLFFVSESLRAGSEMQIMHLPFLTTQDSAHSGEKPLRTYSGPRYIGGVSDHCPVVLIVHRP